jgi:hypothetical protein
VEHAEQGCVAIVLSLYGDITVERSETLTELFASAFCEPTKGSYGRWQPDVLTDDALRQRANRLLLEVNSALQDARERVEHPAPAPDLYFDFIESKSINAGAKEYRGACVFGVTRPFLSTVPELVARLLARDAVWEILLIKTNGSDEERAEAERMLFDVLFVFVTNHELGHIVHGHTTEASEEWNRIRNDDGAILPKQAAEIDADGYSCFATLNWLFSRVPPNAEALGVPLLRLFIIAAACYLEVGAANIWNWTAQFMHPQYLTRIDFILGHTLGWCQEQCPSLAASLSHEIAHNAFKAVESCWPERDSRPLGEQVAELTAGPYQEWEGHIAAERTRIRELLAPFSWRVRGYQTVALDEPVHEQPS